MQVFSVRQRSLVRGGITIFGDVCAAGDSGLLCGLAGVAVWAERVVRSLLCGTDVSPPQS